MIVYENDCVGCPIEIGCLFEACPYYKVEYHYCDICGDEAKYEYGSKEYCLDCLINEIGAFSIE